MRATFAAGVAVGIALGIAGVWFWRAKTPSVETALDGTVMIAITRHDALGQPAKPLRVKDRVHVRALVAALGVDDQPVVPCPADYASAELGLLLSGKDVYARRNVYVWGDRMIVTTEAGCHGGPVPDAATMRNEIAAARE